MTQTELLPTSNNKGLHCQRGPTAFIGRNRISFALSNLIDAALAALYFAGVIGMAALALSVAADEWR